MQAVQSVLIDDAIKTLHEQHVLVELGVSARPDSTALRDAKVGDLVPEHGVIGFVRAPWQFYQPMLRGLIIRQCGIGEPAVFHILGQQKLGGRTLNAGCASGEHGVNPDVIKELFLPRQNALQGETLFVLTKLLCSSFLIELHGGIEAEVPDGVESAVLRHEKIAMLTVIEREFSRKIFAATSLRHQIKQEWGQAVLRRLH